MHLCAVGSQLLWLLVARGVMSVALALLLFVVCARFVVWARCVSVVRELRGVLAGIYAFGGGGGGVICGRALNLCRPILRIRADATQ